MATLGSASRAGSVEVALKSVSARKSLVAVGTAEWFDTTVRTCMSL